MMILIGMKLKNLNKTLYLHVFIVSFIFCQYLFSNESVEEIGRVFDLQLQQKIMNMGEQSFKLIITNDDSITVEKTLTEWKSLSKPKKQEKFLKILKRFANKNWPAELEDNDYRYFMRFRLLYLNLKNIFDLFHIDHSIPENIYQFSKFLGQIKDYNNLNQRELKKKKIKKVIKWFKLNREDVKLVDNFEFDSVENITQYFISKINALAQMVEKNRKSVYDLHSIRKEFKKISLIIHLIYLRNNQIVNILDVNQTIYRHLGKMKDLFLARKIKGELSFKGHYIAFDAFDQNIILLYINILRIKFS